MFDLIGYWTAVTALVTPPVLLMGIVLFYCLNEVLKHASRNRFDLFGMVAKEYYTNKRWPKEQLSSDLGAVTFFSVVIGIFSYGVALVVVSATTEDDAKFTLLSFISHFAEQSACFFSWIGMLAIAYLLVFVVMRKVFDVGYAIKDKLDNTENK